MTTDFSEFLKTNIERKMQFMQAEHIRVLQILYKSACEQHTVDKFEFLPNVIPRIKYSDLKKKLGDMDNFVLHVCLVDLKGFGFIESSQISGRVEYTITRLGLKCIEYY